MHLVAMLQKRRSDGRLSQHVFGGQFGKRGTIGALRMCRIAFGRLGWIA